MISIKRIWLPIFTCCFSLSFATPVLSVEYSVDGLKLGEIVAGAGVQSYNCKPSDAFAQLTTCSRTQTRNKGYNYGAFSSVMHDENGAAVFLKIKVAPVPMTKNDAQKEIDQLTK